MSYIKPYNLFNEDKKTTYILYHGSNNYFKEFDITEEYTLHGDAYGEGFYFTDSYAYASNFGKYIYECKIVLNNPIDLTNEKKAKDALLKLNSNNLNSNYNEIITELINGRNFKTAFYNIRKEQTIEDFKKLGYDGVIGYADWDSGKEYITYYKNNIKILNIKER